MNESMRDVTVIGGGLAGLTLALQLRKNYPDLDVLVLERNAHPVPAGTHKVGESTVEIGAHYLADELDLKRHLQDKHLRKYGLRMFFQGPVGGRARDLAAADEIGVSQLLNIPSYQIDRGILENELGRRAREAGIDFRGACRVTRARIQDNHHEIVYRRDGAELEERSRWLVDASSRHSPLKRAMGVEKENAHAINAAWFRVEGRLSVDEWSGEANWHRRCPQFSRWHSTNHLMGAGYWVWLIPLSSNMTSVGIVADPELHPLEAFNTLARATAWLQRYEPRCAEALSDHPVLDFRFLRDPSHNCRQVFSDNQWALTGESGVFIDPLYSPGTDFIAISNSYITRLIGQSLEQENLRHSCLMFQQFYFSFYRSTLAIYQGLYPGFGDRHLMALKTTWDFSYYWGVLALLYFTGGIADEPLMLGASSGLLGIQRRNESLQKRFRERATRRIEAPARALFVDQRAIPCLVELNAVLARPGVGPPLAERLQQNICLLQDLGDRIERRIDNPKALADARERELLGDLRERLL